MRWWRDAAARGALCRGGAGGAVSQRELERALLEADDAVGDVFGVREDGRRDDLGHVVRQVVGRVEARVARPIPPALPVFGTTGKKAEAPGTAAPYATERLYYQRHHLVTFDVPRVYPWALAGPAAARLFRVGCGFPGVWRVLRPCPCAASRAHKTTACSQVVVWFLY